jgi:catechol 2,3-dioxygenase-like lactoylglutathione lyase family enzyme
MAPLGLQLYDEALCMKEQTFSGGRRALSFGLQKINLHRKSAEFEPKAAEPTPGSADLCFIVSTPLVDFLAHLMALEVPIEESPVVRTGATGPITSVYVRDPDANLIEMANLNAK